MQKDKVGLNIYTIQYTFKVSLLPETALIDIKWYLTGSVLIILKCLIRTWVDVSLLFHGEKKNNP